MNIDLNCDMGEGCGHDAELLNLISSANIACGYHAGDATTMRLTAEMAVEKGVAIGAHPGYRDRENFGRTEMSLSPKEVFDLVTEQIALMNDATIAAGGKVVHVKPHGALYNQAARDRELAAAIAEAVAAFDKDLVLFGLSGSVCISEAEKCGLTAASEVFADRTYRNDGSLTPRTQSNALVENDDVAVAQALQMALEGEVASTTGDLIPVRAETICLHGDGAHAVEFATAIRTALLKKGVTISPVSRKI
ncbi:MAG: 5-oxoprolinase subunit PxpA [Acidobacteria bacterium]|nr:5-oxoprolinase subunit PxpA [Acidobacteriota bacterium]